MPIFLIILSYILFCRVVQESLSKLIDLLGEQSATAQGLSKVITTAEKFRNSPTHTLYLLKDTDAKG